MSDTSKTKICLALRQKTVRKKNFLNHKVIETFQINFFQKILNIICCFSNPICYVSREMNRMIVYKKDFTLKNAC